MAPLAASRYVGGMKPCPICSNMAQHEDTPLDDGAVIDCPKCGKYRAAIVLLPDLNGMQLDWKYRLSRAIRLGNDRGGFTTTLTRRNYEGVIASCPIPANVLAQIDALVLAIADRAPFIGDQTQPEPLERWAARLGLPSGGHVSALASNTGREALVSNAGRTNGEVSFGLTHPGWERVEHLRRAAPDSNQVFVAMWFDSSMGRIWESAIRPAIGAVGLDAYRVDEDPGHERVDDKIMAQIRRSRALVADLTGLRGGVYFEAGFAMGLGMPVIFTCSESWVDQSGDPWFKGVHFDVNHYPFILWKNAEHLREQLMWRLAASGIGHRIPEPG